VTPCPSPFQLDRLSAGEPTGLERLRLERHLAGCAACERGLVERGLERARFVPERRTLARLAPRRPWPALAVLAIACAVLVQRSEPAIPRAARAKGGAVATLIVERAGARSVLDARAHVRPGDRLQVLVRVPTPRFVAVYSRDGAGEVTRYAPLIGMLAVAPGADQPLPNSTILDAVPGREVVAVFACAAPLPDAVLRAAVVAGAPPGCEVTRTELTKP
jgi:hypothetical protein